MPRCQHCDGPMPATASTGRPRVYCSPACRKAAYEERRARKPDATRVRLVEQQVVETLEHDITECARRVAESPRGVANVLKSVTALIDKPEFDGPEWEPAFRQIQRLLRVARTGRR